ncbi:MAG TPA: Gfo/Idh/MocA family oxidoreductase, partial [Armatimonadetes bacterium]|nr:Gfo/Idh/MocA family oxidoreductase [Armatimonadota bacterium]
MMDKLRIGVVGLGMGRSHVHALKQMDDVEVHALCDVNEGILNETAEQYEVPQRFTNLDELLRTDIDAVLICTPHFLHRDQVIASLEAGKHVFCEKPMAVTVREADEMVETAQRTGLKLALGFQRRTNPRDKTIKQLIPELGEISRGLYETCSMRTQAYYNSGAWRGTWWGEGGAVLINQAVHDLDAYQWWMGLPRYVVARAVTFAHDIESEDMASAIFEYDNYAQVMFQATLVNYPSISRFEVCGDRGALIYDGAIRIARLDVSLREFIATCQETWGHPEKPEWEDVQVPDEPSGHAVLLHDFVRAVLDDREPLASGEEGVKSVELVNAIIMSSVTGEPVEIP